MSNAFLFAVSLVDRYLQDGDFWSLWRPVAGPDIDLIDHSLMSRDEQRAFDEMYELVYLGQPDSATADERADGALGGPVLRAQLERWRANVGSGSAT